MSHLYYSNVVHWRSVFLSVGELVVVKVWNLCCSEVLLLLKDTTLICSRRRRRLPAAVVAETLGDGYLVTDFPRVPSPCLRARAHRGWFPDVLHVRIALVGAEICTSTYGYRSPFSAALFIPAVSVRRVVPLHSTLVCNPNPVHYTGGPLLYCQPIITS